ncbi:hypothetical protein [Crocosphaera chwakensis]|uniref:Uncharacterized protein n=1 Tax=Crocosphaera chwakensis CCY0110 TaxID=391612 RepID=A3IZ34_9CHRO|nr:hypothetical protein [Crocosphaera chwakensis]EAZ88273.1 hypothetical protein CY0110_06649 [Crocosphaera chwakensis CCY0110]
MRNSFTLDDLLLLCEEAIEFSEISSQSVEELIKSMEELTKSMEEFIKSWEKQRKSWEELRKYQEEQECTNTLNDYLNDHVTLLDVCYRLIFSRKTIQIIELMEELQKTESKSLVLERELTSINFFTIKSIFELESKKCTQILIKIMKEYITIIFSLHLFQKQRKYRRYVTQLKHINSEFWDISHRIISIFSVFYLFTRHIITFTFSKISTEINRLKKDDGEIRHEIPQYWPSSKYRKKRRVEFNHTINCLLQTQFCFRQTLSNFDASYEFSVSRIY